MTSFLVNSIESDCLLLSIYVCNSLSGKAGSLIISANSGNRLSKCFVRQCKATQDESRLKGEVMLPPKKSISSAIAPELRLRVPSLSKPAVALLSKRLASYGRPALYTISNFNTFCVPILMMCTGMPLSSITTRGVGNMMDSMFLMGGAMVRSSISVFTFLQK